MYNTSVNISLMLTFIVISSLTELIYVFDKCEM